MQAGPFITGEPGQGAGEERGGGGAGGRADALQDEGGGEDLRPRSRGSRPGWQGGFTALRFYDDQKTQHHHNAM